MLLKFHLISLKLAATTPQKSLSYALHGLRCCGWRDTVRSMWRFLSAWRKHKNVPMVAATLQPMPVKAVAAWRIFWGRVGETFGRKIWNVGMASGRHNRHVFFYGGVSFIEMGTPPRRPPYAVSCRGVFHGFLRWVRLIMNRHTSAYITWTSLMGRLKI